MFGALVLVASLPDIWKFLRDHREDVRRAREYGQNGINEVRVSLAPKPDTDVPNRTETEEGFVDDRPGPVEPPDDLALPPAAPKRLR